jgi:hypothetical protein
MGAGAVNYDRRHDEAVRTVRVLRRALLALTMAALAAAAIRVRGRGGVPPQSGGWQELPLNDRH